MRRRRGLPAALLACLGVVLCVAAYCGCTPRTAGGDALAPPSSSDVSGPVHVPPQTALGLATSAEGLDAGDVADGGVGAVDNLGELRPVEPARPGPSGNLERGVAVRPPARGGVLAGEGTGADDGSAPLRTAVAALAEQLRALWHDIAAPAVNSSPDGPVSVVVAEVPLWEETAVLRASYDVVDLDHLKERIATRRGGSGAYAGVNGELQLGNAVSLKIGYTLWPAARAEAERISGAADAGVAYRLGDSMDLGAGVVWGLGASPERAARIDVSYAVAQGATLRAGYRLLSFADADDAFHHAEAGVQLRF